MFFIYYNIRNSIANIQYYECEYTILLFILFEIDDVHYTSTYLDEPYKRLYMAECKDITSPREI